MNPIWSENLRFQLIMEIIRKHQLFLATFFSHTSQEEEKTGQEEKKLTIPCQYIISELLKSEKDLGKNIRPY
jgi:hypothetical protein